MRYIFFILFTFCFYISFAQKKNKSKLLLGIHFPGFGYSKWNIEGEQLYFQRPDNPINEKFKGKGLNIFYGIDILYGKKIKAGISIGQQYFHIHQFFNPSREYTLEPVFITSEQTHFHKLLLQIETDLHDRKIRWSFNIQGGLLFPKRIFNKEYIEKAYTINGGPLVSFWISHKVDFFIKLSGEYLLFIHQAGQSPSQGTIALNQDSSDKRIKNNIYSANISFGARVNLLKKIRNPRFRT